MSDFALPRYAPRVFVEVLTLDDNDDPNQFWFAAFNGDSAFTVGWPTQRGTLRFGLGPLGLPIVRPR